MRKAFTLIELLVVVSIIALLIAILLPSLSKARDSAMQMQSTTQVRGIHQGFNVHAVDHKNFYPGLRSLTLTNADYTPTTGLQTVSGSNGRDVLVRLIIALESDLFTPDILISPAETNPIVQKWDRNTVYPTNGSMRINSYAMSKLFDGGSTIEETAAKGRREEWRATMNSRGIVIGDRCTSFSGAFRNTKMYQGLWSKGEPGWVGTVVYNDNSTFFSFDNNIDGTEYGDHANTQKDDIFLGLYDRNRNRDGGNGGNNCDLVVSSFADNILAAE